MGLTVLRIFLVPLCSILVQGGADRVVKSRECIPSITAQGVTPKEDVSHAGHNYGMVPDLHTCTQHCCDSANECDLALFDGKHCLGVKCNSQHVCKLIPSEPGLRSYNAAFIGFIHDHHGNKQGRRSSKRSRIPGVFRNESDSIIKALEEMSEGHKQTQTTRGTSSSSQGIAIATGKPSATSKLERSKVLRTTKFSGKKQSKSRGKYHEKTKSISDKAMVHDTLNESYRIHLHENVGTRLKGHSPHKKTASSNEMTKKPTKPKTSWKAAIKTLKHQSKSQLQITSKRRTKSWKDKKVNVGGNRRSKQTLKASTRIERKEKTAKAPQDLKLENLNKLQDDSAATKQGTDCYATNVVKDSAFRAGMDAGKFTIHKQTNNITECVEYCCNIQHCDVAVIMAGTCYSVQCKSERHCKSKPIGGNSSSLNPVLAYVHNELNQGVLGHHFVEVKPTEDKTIIKKTVVPDPSQGDVGTVLDSLQFRNGPSVVSSSFQFGYYQQCSQYVEPENVTKPGYSWVTERLSPFSYLYQLPSGTAPPLGMRSAVPLGGMGTGSFEIRADGSFSEWTLENQSPGGSAKLGRGALDLAVFGVRVRSPQGSKSALLRTHPPKSFPGVQALAYSGSYPVSKLSVIDEGFYGISIDLYAFGTLHTRKTAASFVPAVTFTLNVKNPTKTAVDISFLLNLPLCMQPDTSRNGGDMEKIPRVNGPSDCAALCNAKAACMAWEHGDNTCLLKDIMPLHAYRAGISSGVKGAWAGHEDSLTLARPGKFPTSGTTTVLSANTNKPTFAVSDDFSEIWESFEKRGSLKATVRGTGFNGATAVSARLPAGEAETLTLIMAWHYPNRDHTGRMVGNYYSELFKSSIEVARHARNDILTNLQDVAAWQSNMMPPKALFTGSSKPFYLPGWLQDHLVNSLSFWRSGFRVADGRWRQWEAYDCIDVDSVHNDFQRELPYILFFPDLLESVVRAWARYQHQDGLVQETLQSGCHGRTGQLDHAGGRIKMADVNAAFITQVYHLYLWTADEKLLKDLWPAVRKAALWLLKNSTQGTGLPLRMTNTYDLLHLEVYDHNIYNSVLYLLSMRVAETLAEVKGDGDIKRKAKEAFAEGRTKIQEEMWDEEKGFYRAWWDRKKGSPDWLMADSLYGQVWAYTLGLGSLLDSNKMRTHLKKEAELNDTPYGLRVMSTGTVADIKLKHFKPANVSLDRNKREKKGEDPFKELSNFFTRVDIVNKNKSNSTAAVVNSGAENSTIPIVNSRAHNSTLIPIVNSRVYNSTLISIVNSRAHNSTLIPIVNSRVDNSTIPIVNSRADNYTIPIVNSRAAVKKNWTLAQVNSMNLTKAAIGSRKEENHDRKINKAVAAENAHKYPETKKEEKIMRQMTELLEKENKTTGKVEQHVTDNNNSKDSNTDKGNQNDVSHRKIPGNNSEMVARTLNQKFLEGQNSLITEKQPFINNSNATEHNNQVRKISGNILEIKEKTRKPQYVGVTQNQLRHHDCKSLMSRSQHQSIWMGGSSDWSTLQIHLGMDPQEALKQAEKSLEHYRLELNDLWSVHGLTAGQGYGLDGQPWCTSHYTFHLVLWHIPFALSGQWYSAIEEKLDFNPKVNDPYVLPFFVPSASGTIESKLIRGHVTEYSLTVTSGLLKLKSLSVDGKKYGKEIVAKQGDFIRWEAE